MASDKQLVNAQQSVIADTPEVYYTSPTTGTGTLITAVTASNGTATDRNYKGYIVSSGGTATLPQVPTTVVNANKADLAEELAGQVIPTGGTLQFESSAIDSIAFTVSGRDLS